jgi:hypothetical protein
MFRHVRVIIRERFRACWVTSESNAMVDKTLRYMLLCVCYVVCTDLSGYIAECVRTAKNQCICWLFMNIEQKMHGMKIKIFFMYFFLLRINSRDFYWLIPINCCTKASEILVFWHNVNTPQNIFVQLRLGIENYKITKTRLGSRFLSWKLYCMTTSRRYPCKWI